MFDYTSIANMFASVLPCFLIGAVAWRLVQGTWKRSLTRALVVGGVQTGAFYAITAVSPGSSRSLEILTVAGAVTVLGVLFADRVLPDSAPRKP